MSIKTEDAIDALIDLAGETAKAAARGKPPTKEELALAIAKQGVGLLDKQFASKVTQAEAEAIDAEVDAEFHSS